MKKVVILSLHLGYGGVEKSVAALANMLVSKYDVEIVCSYKLYDKPRFPIDPKVKIRYLINTDLPIKLQEYNVLLKSFKFKKLFRRLNRDYFKKKQIKQFFSDGFNGFTMFKKRKSTMIDYIKSSDADIIISSRDIFDEWLGYYGSKDIVKIGWEHNHFHNNYKYARKIVNSCSKLDYLVLVSKELYDYYSKEMRRYKCKCINIPNVIDKIPVRSSHLTEKRLISVGRLSHEKGFLDLLKIFNKIHEDYPDWHLDIIGDGVDKIKLKDYIQDNDLDNSVTLHGFRDKDYINELLHNSSLYLMTSYTESFGIVLIEAMSHGVPCIAFDSAEGAREIISSGFNGYLIKNRNSVEYVRKCEQLMDDIEKRKKIGKAGKESVKKYSVDVVKKDWYKLLEK